MHLRWINSAYLRIVKVIRACFSKLMCLHLSRLPPLEGCQWEVSEDSGGQGQSAVDLAASGLQKIAIN